MTRQVTFYHSFFRLIASFTLISLLAACSVAPVLAPVTNLPGELQSQPLAGKNRALVALVLGSGAARGFAHVGVLKVLEANGIQADIVVGSSSGAVVGALYAGGIRGHELVEAAAELDMGNLTDWIFPNRGVVRGERLQQYLNQRLQNRPIEALPIKYVAVATDLVSGTLMAFNHGDTGMAVRASSAIPGLVQPVLIDGREYVDGGVVSQVPVHVARKLGADVIIAIDVSRHPLPADQLSSTLAVMQQAIIVMSNQIAEAELAYADIVIRPNVGAFGIDDFDLRDQVLAAGEAAALEALTEIKRLINEKTAQKRAHPE